MYIDITLLVVYAVSGALMWWAFDTGSNKKDEGLTVVAVLLGLGIVISWFQWSGTYIIISAAETGLGVFLMNLILKGKK